MRRRMAVFSAALLLSSLPLSTAPMARAADAPPDASGAVLAPEAAAAPATQRVSDYVPLDPARVLDTRPGVQTVDDQFRSGGVIPAGGSIDVAVTGRGGIPTDGVGAVVLNITVTEPNAPGYITAWPTGSPRPLASTINFTTGATIANGTTAKVGTGGKVSLYASATTHLVVDIVGWIPAASATTPVDPARLLDTRTSGNTIDGTYRAGGVIPAGGSIDIAVTGRGGIPTDGVGAVVLNITVTEPNAPGYITAWPTGSPRPLASTINFTTGATIANGTTAKVGTGGKVSLYASATTHLVVDIVGWIPVAINAIDPMVRPLDPATTVVKGDVDSNVAVVLPPGTDVRPGEIIVTSVADKAFYGRVTATSGDTALAEAVTLGDVIPEVDLQLAGDPESGAITARTNAIGSAPISVAFDPATIDAYRAYTSASRIGTKCKSTLTSSEWPFLFDTDAGVNFIFEPSWGWKGMERLKVAIQPHLGFTGTVDIGGQVECALNVGLFSRNLPTLRFNIGPVPVVITLQLDVKAYVKLTAEAGVKASFGASVAPEIGILYQNGQFSPVAVTNFTPNVNLGVNPWGKVDIEAGIPVRVDAKAYGVLGFYGEVGPYARLRLDPTVAANQNWVTLAGGIRAAAGLTAGVKIGPIKWQKDHQLGEWFPFQRNNVWGTNAGRPSPPVVPPPVTTTTQPPATTTTVAPPRVASIAVGKGGSAQGRPGCTSVYCAMVNVQLSNFAPNSTVTVVCNDTTAPPGEFYRYNVRTDGNGNNFSSVCYYGFPGQAVWITANGVRSPDFRW